MSLAVSLEVILYETRRCFKGETLHIAFQLECNKWLTWSWKW